MKIKTFSFNNCVPSKGRTENQRNATEYVTFLDSANSLSSLAGPHVNIFNPNRNNKIDVLKQNTKNESNALLFCSNIQYSCTLWTHNQINQWRRMPFDQPMPHKFMKIMDAMPTATRRRSPWYTSYSSPFHIIVGASYKESPNIANKNTKLIYHISCSLPSPSPKLKKEVQAN